LADFEAKAQDYRAAGIRLLAASVDSEEDARKVVRDLNLSYPIAYGLAAEEISALTGAYYDADKKFLHGTGFILKPDGIVAGAVYSTGPIGRYTAADALDLVTLYSKRK
jgi:peroxiredoxin